MIEATCPICGHEFTASEPSDCPACRHGVTAVTKVHEPAPEADVDHDATVPAGAAISGPADPIPQVVDDTAPQT